MKEDLLLQLQAWVDGELPETEARRVAELVQANADARGLVAELRTTKSFLSGNELEVKLPETREFYWSKIQRQIQQLEPAAASPSSPSKSWLLLWRRFLTPLSGLALIAFVSVLSLNLYQRGEVNDRQHLVEVENLSEHVGSISYKSQSENMFVVYLYNKDQEADATDKKFEPLDEPVIQ